MELFDNKTPRALITYQNPLMLDSPRKGINLLFDTIQKKHIECNDWDLDLADEIVDRYRKPHHVPELFTIEKGVIIPVKKKTLKTV